MAQGSAQFHEAEEALKQGTMERHRAIVSLMEELEAVDWYDQRVDATTDDELRGDPRPQPGRGEGARGHDARVAAPQRPGLDEMLRTYLFTEGPITEVEDEAEAAARRRRPPVRARRTRSLGIGALSDKETL